MQEVDGKEHEVAGCDVGRESTGGDSHVTVRLHYPPRKTTRRPWRAR